MVPESTASTFRQNRYSPYTLYDTCLFLRTNTTPRGSKPNGVQCCFHSKKRQIQQTTQALNIYANEQTAKAKRAYSYNSAIVSLGTKIRRITEKLLFFAYICTRRGYGAVNEIETYTTFYSIFSKYKRTATKRDYKQLPHRILPKSKDEVYSPSLQRIEHRTYLPLYC